MKKYILLVIVLFAFARPAYGMTNVELLNAIISIQRQIAVLQSQLDQLKAKPKLMDNQPNKENVELLKSTVPVQPKVAKPPVKKSSAKLPLSQPSNQ